MAVRDRKNKKSKRVTLTDIARKVGCSPAAVSYAILRNHPLSDELKKRIWKAIDELNYHPYMHHNRQKRNKVAILSDDTSSTHSEILRLYNQELTARGLQMQIHLLPMEISWETFGNMLGNSFCNDPGLLGLICQHPTVRSFDLLRYCRDIPAVISSREGSMSSHGYVKLQKIGSTAGYFLDYLNYPEAVFCYLKPAEPEFLDTIFLALTQELEKRGAVIHVQRKIIPPEPAEYTRMFNELYRDGVRAFFAHSVSGAELILQWAYALHYRLPEDFSLFCVDYDMTAERLIPPVSTVSLPYPELVRFTIDELIAQTKHIPIEPCEFLPFITERASTIRCGNALSAPE